MHSFHQSRGRIYFDIFCALTIAASCGVAWLQTGASALLAIAGVAALYSVVHATDAGPKRAAVVADVPTQATADDQGDLLAYEPPVAVEPVVIEPVVAEPEPKAEKAKRRSRKKQPAVEIVAIAEPEVTDAQEQPPQGFEPEEFHAHIEPLFEPQPLVRQQRAVFGRKAG